ncbi:MAG: hypothetical protein QMC98_01630 [Candidatus Thermoplasmatota archaeon]|nr:hypothetical protein [Candidatus Thermoplasmatota archaeon]
MLRNKIKTSRATNCTRTFSLVIVAILVIAGSVGIIQTDWVSGTAKAGTVLVTSTIGSGGSREFSFAIIADPQGSGDYGTPGWFDEPPAGDVGSNIQLLREIVNEINAKRVDYDIRFVMVLGDITGSAQLSELKKAKEILDSLEVPYVPLIGNHDVWPYVSCAKFNDKTSSFIVSNTYLDERVILYKNDNYGGTAETFIGEDRRLSGNGIGDNAVSSLKVIGACSVTLYQDDDFMGDSITFNGPCDIPSLSVYGWNDKASSIKVYDCNSRGVVLHGGADYTERGHLFFNNVPSLPTTDYNGFTCLNDAISCVKLINGAEVILYENSNYGGASIHYGTSVGTPCGDPNLNDEYVHPWDTHSDYYFNEIYAPVYDKLAQTMPNWRKAPTPVWNPQTSPQHYNYFQNFAFDYGSYHFICLDFNARDDAPLNKPGVSGEGDIHDFSGGTYQWFKDHLANYAPKGNENIFIFAHHPYTDGWGGVMGFSSGEFDLLVQAIQPYHTSVNTWFAGHLHRNAEYWNSDYDGSGVQMFKVIETDAACEDQYDGIDSAPETYDNAGDYRIVEIYTTTQSFSCSLSKGWNFITLPLKTSYKRGEDLVQAIPNCSYIRMWNSTTQTFETHVKGTNENNFTIDDGIGYFVFLESASTFEIQGAKIILYSTSLAKNWNSIGWYNETSTTAESLAQNITNCKVIAYWDSNLGRFVTHPIGTNISNFAIERGKGYFAYIA